MKIQVRINEDGALRNQRYAFSDKFTLVSELLQNSRRAGATLIAVDHDSVTQVLRVIDNGCGIEDWQKLLTFNESGWDDTTCRDEQPFGIGFSKCLYSATRCIVTSLGKRIDFETEPALARTPIEVVSAPADELPRSKRGTEIELHGVVLPDLASCIASMCLGFPVAVLFNGDALRRPYAIGHLPMSPSPIGPIFLTGTRDGKHSRDTLVFLQGLCVWKPVYFRPDHVNAIHLDPRQFMARLPDRDKLIDEDDQRKRIDGAMKDCWRHLLEVFKHWQTGERFIETYYAAMRSWQALDLLNDIDQLPGAVCSEIAAYPYQEGGGARDYLQTVAAPPTRHDVEGNEVTLVVLDEVNGDNAGRWMFARAKGHLVLNTIGLHVDHWAQRHVRYLEQETLHVEAVGPTDQLTLEGRWIGPEVVLCAKVRIHVGEESVEIADDGVFHDDTLYIPAGETTGKAIRQASNFFDDRDQFLEADLEADRSALNDLIRRLRSVDAADTLSSLLSDLNLEKYPLLHGKTFRLSVGRAASSHSIDLLG